MSENKTNVSLEEYQGALAKITSQETQIAQLTSQLAEATDTLALLKTKFDSAEAGEKADVIAELVRDSNGKLTGASLQKHTLTELYLIKDAIAKAEPKTFLSVMRQREKDTATPKPHGTVGSYNQETGKYEGGINP
ncbi:hypothetical protein MUO79_00965 [Candidatus Bathyarchaeota archaeon]|nr:hypothetical protein [Candidatus Bathyarchaeota archaeon]